MQFEKVIERFKSGINNEKLNLPIPWDWVCNNLISLVQEYSDGVTSTIVKTDLQNKWDLEGIDVISNINNGLNNSFNNNDNEIDYKKPKSLYLSYKRETIPFDSIIETTIQSINRKDNQTNMDDEQQTQTQPKKKLKHHHHQSFSNIITIGDSYYINQLWLHPRFYSYLSEYFGNSPLISPGRNIRISNILQQYSKASKIFKLDNNNNDKNNNNDNNNNNNNNNKKEVQNKKQIILPSSVLIMILKDIEDLSFTERLKHFKLSNIFLNGNKSFIPDENSVLWLRVEKILKVEEKNTQYKWDRILPYDSFLGHSMKQVMILSELIDFRKDNIKDQSLSISPYSVELVFWDEQIGYLRLLQKGEKIRIKGVYYNNNNNFNNLNNNNNNTNNNDNNNNRIVLEVLPSSTICVLPNDNKINSTINSTTTTATTTTTTTTSYTTTLENTTSKISERLDISNAFGTNFSLLVNIIEIDFSKKQQIIYKVYQNNTIAKTIDIVLKIDENNSKNNNNNIISNSIYKNNRIEEGQLVYFKNLNIKDGVVYCIENSNNPLYNNINNNNNNNNNNNRYNYIIISKIQGLLSSRFLYNQINIDQLNDYSNSVFIGAIIGINNESRKNLQKVHSVCNKEIDLTNTDDDNKDFIFCQHCNRSINQEVEIMLKFNFTYKICSPIGIGNDVTTKTRINLSATSTAHFQFLQLNESEFELLPIEKQTKLFNLIIGKFYYLSISKIDENQFRIDNCSNYQY
ncbi:hypothetical protein ACTFIW_002252 [Dictyostelium discoideum]